jgi:multidrug efflux pump subunit AcrA (membrane-fusion protein)
VTVAAKITMQIKTLIPAAAGLILLGAAAGLLAPSLFAQDRGGTDDPKRWQAVAPGRVEPWSGEIKVTSAAIGSIGELLVKPTDKVFAGELMIRLRDEEVVTRVATAEAQVAMRKRARNDQTASNRVADRRRGEDLVADAERTVVDTRAAIDTASIAKRAGTGSEGDIQAARAAHTRAHDRLMQEPISSVCSTTAACRCRC